MKVQDSILCMIFLHLSFAEESILPLDLLQKNILDDLPKMWFNYIDTFLHRSNYNFTEKRTQLLVRALKVLAVNSKSFCLKAVYWSEYSSYNTPFLTFIQNSGRQQMSLNYFEYVYSANITAPCGKLGRQGFVKIGSETWKFSFQLAKSFRLNVTVNYLYLSSNSFDKCKFGSFNMSSSIQFKYCGIYSKIIYYSFSNNVTISLFVLHFVSFDANMTFSVVDSNKIISLRPKYIKMKISAFTLKFKSKNTTFYQMFLQVDKYFEMVLRVTNTTQKQIRIYDGPGVESDILKPVPHGPFDNKYYLSTFQGVVCISLPNYPVSFSNTIEYSGERKVFFHNVMLYEGATSKMHYPGNEKCINNVTCTFKFQTQVYFFIEIEILRMKYVGYNDTGCRYGGLAIYDTNGSHSESSVLCSNQNPHRNVYSTSNTLLAVFYSYNKYVTEFNTAISVSVTKCKAVTLNACQYKFFPVHSPAKPFYTVEEGPCQIVRLTYTDKNRTSKEAACAAYVKPGNAMEHGKIIQYNVTAFFKTFYHLDYFKLPFMTSMFFLGFLLMTNSKFNLWPRVVEKQ